MPNAARPSWRLNSEPNMKLSKFDGKRVRILTVWGDELDGICQHNSADYNFHEFGKDEEGLQLSCLLLYKSDIKRIKELKKGFPTPFGKLEEMTVEDDVDIIDEVLFCEEDESVLRLLACMESRLGSGLPCAPEALVLVQKLCDETQSEPVRAAALRLLRAAKPDSEAE